MASWVNCGETVSAVGGSCCLGCPDSSGTSCDIFSEWVAMTGDGRAGTNGREKELMDKFRLRSLVEMTCGMRPTCCRRLGRGGRFASGSTFCSSSASRAGRTGIGVVACVVWISTGAATGAERVSSGSERLALRRNTFGDAGLGISAKGRLITGGDGRRIEFPCLLDKLLPR